MEARVYRIARPGRAAALLLAATAAMACGGEVAPPGVRGAASEGLVFVRPGRGGTDLARARIADGAVRAQTRSAEREERWPYWSERGRRLVFQARPAGSRGGYDLLAWAPGAEGERALARTPERDERWPAWGPEGRRLVYAFRGGRPPAGVALLELASGARELLAETDARSFFYRPTWAPDGERLVAQRRGAGSGGSDLWILAPGRAPRPLVRNPGRLDAKAFFTRDGRFVVFARGPASGPRDVMRVRADGTELRTLAGRPEADEHSGRPSPARDEIAFVSTRAGTADIYLADLEGGDVRRLTRTPEREEYAPRWSPDGERLVVTWAPRAEGGDRSGRQLSVATTRLVVLDREGRALFEAPGAMADWMPPWP